MSSDLLLPSIRARLHEIEALLGRIQDACRFHEQVTAMARQEEAMSREGFWDAPQEAARIIAELKVTRAVVEDIRALQSRLSDAQTLLELGEEAGDEATYKELDRDTRRLFADASSLELRTLLNGEYDAEGCYLDINAGEGGTESCDWAAMLRRMYLRWAQQRGFKTEILDELGGEEAGIKSTSIRVSGPFAYGYLRAEVGVHRLVRISPFDTKGRRHTSFASVGVSPDVVEALDIEINEADLRIDTYRSSGAGGQHVNTTDSAVRITHLPTGIVVSCQNERSQHSNRAQCMRVLQSRLVELELKRREEKLAKMGGIKGEISFGNQIRSYVLAPYKLVKDHRTDHETGNIDGVLDGDLDPFIEAYLRLLAKGASAARSGPR